MNGEACRVSYRPARGRRLLVALTAAVLMAGVSGCAANEPAVKVSVSYTHLTLPTILRV